MAVFKPRAILYLDSLQFGEWSLWGECSHPYCGGGTKTRYRKCIADGENAPRKECKATKQSKSCNEEPCPGWYMLI